MPDELNPCCKYNVLVVGLAIHAQDDIGHFCVASWDWHIQNALSLGTPAICLLYYSDRMFIEVVCDTTGAKFCKVQAAV